MKDMTDEIKKAASVNKLCVALADFSNLRQDMYDRNEE